MSLYSASNSTNERRGTVIPVFYVVDVRPSSAVGFVVMLMVICNIC